MNIYELKHATGVCLIAAFLAFLWVALALLCIKRTSL